MNCERSKLILNRIPEGPYRSSEKIILQQSLIRGSGEIILQQRA